MQIEIEKNKISKNNILKLAYILSFINISFL